MQRSPRIGSSMGRTRRFQPSVDRRSIGLLVLLVGAALVTIATSVHAGLYKWTDARGVVHYSDQLPPDAVNRANYQLNRQGLTIRKTEQARPVELRTGKDNSEIERERQAQRAEMLA